MKARFLPPTIRQSGFSKNQGSELENLFLFKGEQFGLQIELTLKEKKWINLNQSTLLPWSGLDELYRIEVTSSGAEVRLSFEEDILDDDRIHKKDRILSRKAGFMQPGTHMLWLDGRTEISGSQKLAVRIYKSEGYKPEELLFEKTLELTIADYDLPEENEFYLDLWQHLSSLARFYQVSLWSDEHFEIIGNFIKPLAEAGQKICNLILSDYSWAGQSCYRVYENKSSLYEYNIVEVRRAEGELKLNFKALDRYIELCEKLGMCEEIDLFGIFGNWSAIR